MIVGTIIKIKKRITAGATHIIKKRFNELEKEFNEKIEISTDIVERIKEKSEYKLFGARRINRVIDSEIKGLLDVK